MARYIARRLLYAVPVIWGVSLIVFLTIKLIPGDPAIAMLGPQAEPRDVALLQEALGLNEPIYVQYVKWLNRTLRGDLGKSLQFHEPVLDLLLRKFKNTLILAMASMLISSLLGIVSGILSATRQYSIFDRLSMVLALFGNSMPSFWLGLVLILIGGLQFRWFPISGMYDVRGDGGLLDLLHHLALPALTLGAVTAAITARMMRSTMLEVLRQDYVMTARAKGLTERKVTMKHALRNALLPVVTVLGLQLGFLLGGSVFVETVFSWPGIGQQLYKAIGFRDMPVIQGGVLLIALIFVMANLVVDILYAFIDPRIRYQ